MRKKSPQINFIITSIDRQIRDSVYLAKWNPPLAIDWMETVKSRVESPIYVNMWNKAARQINSFLDSLESCRFYNKRDYWGELPTRRLKLLEETLSIEDWVTLQQLNAEFN